MDPLLVALVEDPADVERYLVYADVLQSRGDPRGELIALQCSTSPTLEQRARERELLARFEQPLRELGASELEWRYGFVRDVLFTDGADTRVLHDPSFDLVEAIRVFGAVDSQALLAVSHPTVEHLTLGSSERLAELVAHFPKLRSVALACAREPDLTPLRGLERCALWLQQRSTETALFAEAWPRLRSLTIGKEQPDDPEHYLALYAGDVVPQLEELGLMIPNLADRVLVDLPRTALWGRVRRLGVRWDRVTASGEKALAAYQNVELALPTPPHGIASSAQRFAFGRLLRLVLRRPAAAVVEYEAACSIPAPTGDMMYGLGNVYGDLDRVDEQLAAYDRAVAITPAHHAAWTRRGSLLVELGRYDDAAASYDHAPNHANALDLYGDLRRRQGRFDEAIALYDRAIALDPDHVALRSKFDILLEAGRAGDALTYIRALRARLSDDRQLARKEARAHLALGDPAAALAIVDELDRGEVGYWDRYTRFAALRDLGRIGEAIAICDELARDKPTFAEVGAIQRGLLTRTAPSFSLTTRETESFLLAIAAAVLGTGAADAATAALDAHLATRRPGYAIARRWDFTDLVDHVADPRLAAAYAKATGRR